MSNVIPLGGITRLDIDPDQVIEEARGKCPDGAVVLGFDVDGDFYFASSIADGGTVIWLLEIAKKALLDIAE